MAQSKTKQPIKNMSKNQILKKIELESKNPKKWTKKESDNFLEKVVSENTEIPPNPIAQAENAGCSIARNPTPDETAEKIFHIFRNCSSEEQKKVLAIFLKNVKGMYKGRLQNAEYDMKYANERFNTISTDSEAIRAIIYGEAERLGL